MKKPQTKTMILHKYISSEYALQAIQDQTLRLTPPKDLNDPFENNWTLIGEKSFKEVYDESIALGELSRANQLKFLIENNIRENEIPKLKIQAQLNQFGIISMSRNPKNLLMWSHYATNHKGVCISYSTDSLPFKKEILQISSEKREQINSCQSVIYSQEREEIKRGSHLYSILNKKSIDWAYEEEVRFILPLKDGHSLKNNPEVYLLNIPSDKFLGLRIGFACDLQLTQVLYHQFKNKVPSGFIKKMTLNKYEYSLDEVDAEAWITAELSKNSYFHHH